MRAVGLFSGGLDSVLSAKIISLFGIDVTAVYCCQPWQEADLDAIERIAGDAGVELRIIMLGRDYLDMIAHPRHGYGKGLNPCIDCHRFMVCRAGDVMQETGASFLFTGEVVGQRPMSQRRACLPLIEAGTGFEGYVLRPLSACLLDPTIPEQKGWVDRSRLFRISGRGRREQMDLAERLGVRSYLPPGGGCLLTEPHFGARLKDFLSRDYRAPEESVVLKWGRYFRLNKDFIAILGRDERENISLERFAYPGDHLVRLADAQGPVLLLKGADPDQGVIARAGGIVLRFSRHRDQPGQRVECFPAGAQEDRRLFSADVLAEPEITAMARQARPG